MLSERMQRALRALLLAAGCGERLGALTADRPKPMIEIGGKPILQWNVERLAHAGIRDIIVNLHYMPEVIERHFGDGSAFGVSISYAFEPRLLGTAGAARNVAERLGTEDFLVVYGDNLSTIDLTALIATHRGNRADAAIALYRRDDVRASGVAEIDERQRITRFAEKPQAPKPLAGWVNAGYLALRPTVLDMIPEHGPSDFGRDIIPSLLGEGARVYGYRMTEELWWIDTPQDYERTVHAFG